MREEEKGFYYLHKCGDLIFRPETVVKWDPEYFNSSFVRKVWNFDRKNRFFAWRIVLEGLALGCRIDRARELSGEWKLTFEDSVELIRNTADREVNNLMKSGMDVFVKEILKMTDVEYWQNVETFWMQEGKEKKRLIRLV